jgi:hypothetical protein
VPASPCEGEAGGRVHRSLTCPQPNGMLRGSDDPVLSRPRALRTRGRGPMNRFIVGWAVGMWTVPIVTWPVVGCEGRSATDDMTPPAGAGGQRATSDLSAGGLPSGGAVAIAGTPSAAGALAAGGQKATGGTVVAGRATGGAAAGGEGGQIRSGTGGVGLAGGTTGGAATGGTGGALRGGAGGTATGGRVAGDAATGGAGGAAGIAGGGSAGFGGGASCRKPDGEVVPDGAAWACDCNTCHCRNGGIWGTALGCPRTCTSDADCDTSEFCNFAVGSCGGQGTCRYVGDTCGTSPSTVCGCDGVDYRSSCEAEVARVSIRAQGSCAAGPDPAACGGRTLYACASTEYCDYQPGQDCGQADATATCLTRPSACTEELVPVCGCDGETYMNACLANAAGTGIMSTGECPS